MISFILILSFSFSSPFWFIFLWRWWRLSPKKNSHCPPVSIVIAARNELQRLKKLIPHLTTQHYPNFEIILVDDRSGDGTYDYFLKQNLAPLKLIRVNQTPASFNAKKHALTLGIQAAQHECLLFTDADCMPVSKSWVSEMAQGFAHSTDVVLGVSPYYSAKGLLNALIQFETLTTLINYIGCALAGHPYMGVGRNLAYRKSIFFKKKGFEAMKYRVGGDDDLIVNQWANRHNTQVIVSPESLVYSYPKKTWKAYRIQKNRHWSIGKYYKWQDRLLLGIQHLSNTGFWVLLLIASFSAVNYGVMIALLALRWTFVLALHRMAAHKMGTSIRLWTVPIMDIIYAFYASIFGIAAWWTKQVEWKK